MFYQAIFNKITLLLSHQGFQRYFKNTSWLMLEKILRMVAGLFVGVWVARYLGAERFGLLNYAISIVALFSAFATLGLDGIIVRELIKNPEKRDMILGTSFSLKCIVSIFILSIIVVMVLTGGMDKQTGLLIIIIAASLLFRSFNIIQSYFEAKVLSKYFVIVQVISLILVSVAQLIFIWERLSLTYFAAVLSVESLISAIGLIFVYFEQKLNIFHWRIQFKVACRLLKDSWPLILSGIAVSIYMRIDQVMIKHILNADAVGQYAAAVKLSEAWYFIPAIICSSLFPAILNSKKISKEFYYQRLQKLYDLMAWIAIATALPITFLSGWIVNLLYGAKYSESSSVLMVHIWAGLFVFLGVASNTYLVSENYTAISFYRTSIAMVLNVLLNLSLIPVYGIVGAAFATLISYAVATFSVVFFANTRVVAVMLLKSLLLPRFFLLRK